jgi:hypothetical protein
MTGDVMARLDNLSDRVGIDLAAPAVDTERAADSVLVQQIDQTINADLAPVAAPCDAGEVDPGLGAVACTPYGGALPSDQVSSITLTETQMRLPSGQWNSFANSIALLSLN